MYVNTATDASHAGTLDAVTLDGHISLILRGTIDARLREQASVAFSTIMQQRLPVTIIARQATFADSASWAFLVQLVSECNAAGIQVRIDIRDEEVRSVLTELGLVHAA